MGVVMTRGVRSHGCGDGEGCGTSFVRSVVATSIFALCIAFIYASLHTFPLLNLSFADYTHRRLIAESSGVAAERAAVGPTNAFRFCAARKHPRRQIGERAQRGNLPRCLHHWKLCFIYEHRR